MSPAHQAAEAILKEFHVYQTGVSYPSNERVRLEFSADCPVPLERISSIINRFIPEPGEDAVAMAKRIAEQAVQTVSENYTKINPLEDAVYKDILPILTPLFTERDALAARLAEAEAVIKQCRKQLGIEQRHLPENHKHLMDAHDATLDAITTFLNPSKP